MGTILDNFFNQFKNVWDDDATLEDVTTSITDYIHLLILIMHQNIFTLLRYIIFLMNF